MIFPAYHSRQPSQLGGSPERGQETLKRESRCYEIIERHNPEKQFELARTREKLKVSNDMGKDSAHCVNFDAIGSGNHLFPSEFQWTSFLIEHSVN